MIDKTSLYNFSRNIIYSLSRIVENNFGLGIEYFLDKHDLSKTIIGIPYSFSYGELIDILFLLREKALDEKKEILLLCNENSTEFLNQFSSRIFAGYFQNDTSLLFKINCINNFLLRYKKINNAVLTGSFNGYKLLNNIQGLNDNLDKRALTLLANRNKYSELLVAETALKYMNSFNLSSIHHISDQYTNQSYISKVNERVEFDRSFHGNDILKTLGLVESKYVVLNIRTKTTGKRGDNPRDIYEFERYIDMLRVIRQLGLKIVRIGSKNDKHLDYIDQYCVPIYKTELQSVANDVTLIRDSLFSICNASGPVSIARLFHKPVLVLDADGLFCCSNHPGYINLPRSYYLNGEKIPAKELPEQPEWFMFNTFYKILKNRNSTYKYNTSEMLKKCAVEMYYFSKNDKKPSNDQIEFNKKLMPYHHLSLKFSSNVATSWING